MPVKQPTDISEYLASGKTVTVCKPATQFSEDELDDKTDCEELVLKALAGSCELSGSQLRAACNDRVINNALLKLLQLGAVKKRKKRPNSKGLYWSLA